MTGNLLYDVHRDEATGQSSVLATIATPGGYKIFGQGRYVDRLIKQNGQWRFAHRCVDVDTLVSDPTKIVMLADPDVVPLIQPLMEAAIRLGEQVKS